jgi:hypothetical protein
VLAGRGVRLDPVPRGDYPSDLIVTGTVITVVVPGGLGGKQ